jgi:hypothetical protein
MGDGIYREALGHILAYGKCVDGGVGNDCKQFNKRVKEM